MQEKSLPFAFPEFIAGHVWLVGAGPGDPGLLTLHCVHAIRHADHILYDALVDRSCLDLAKSDCVLEFAGKRGGKPSLKQIEITQRMIALAKEGKRVLRLKGGDPFVACWCRSWRPRFAHAALCSCDTTCRPYFV